MNLKKNEFWRLKRNNEKSNVNKYISNQKIYY